MPGAPAVGAANPRLAEVAGFASAKGAVSGSWMSSQEVESLREEVALLRFEFEALRLTVDELVEARAASAVRSAGGPSEAPPASVVASASGAASAFIPTSDIVATSDKEGRAELARHIGRFLRASFEGRRTGSSGRDRLQLRSRLYVALADYQGRRLPKPQVFREFASLAALCKRGPSVGDSVFVGFATEWEARLALEEGGFPWPAQSSDGD